MKALSLTLTFALILSVPGILLAEGKIKLEHKLAVGDRIVSGNTKENYVWADFRQMGGPLLEQTGNIEITTTTDVVSVDENGVMEVKTADKVSGTLKQFDGKTILVPSTEQAPQTFKVTRTGEVVWSDVGDYEPRHPQNPLADIDDWLAYITVRQSSPLAGLPDKEVGVGDIWTTRTTLKGPDGKELVLAAKYRVFAFGKMGDHECAWIHSETKLPFKIEFSGDFEGYSSIAAEGMFIWKGRSCFAYEEGRMITDRSSWDFMMIIEVPLQEGIAKGYFTTIGSNVLTTSMPEQPENPRAEDQEAGR